MCIDSALPRLALTTSSSLVRRDETATILAFWTSISASSLASVASDAVSCTRLLLESLLAAASARLASLRFRGTPGELPPECTDIESRSDAAGVTSAV